MTDDVPDKYLSELHSGDEDEQEVYEEIADDLDNFEAEMKDVMTAAGTSWFLVWLLKEEYITVKKYDELSDYVVEFTREKEVRF